METIQFNGRLCIRAKCVLSVHVWIWSRWNNADGIFQAPFLFLPERNSKLISSGYPVEYGKKAMLKVPIALNIFLRSLNVYSDFFHLFCPIILFQFDPVPICSTLCPHTHTLNSWDCICFITVYFISRSISYSIWASIFALLQHDHHTRRWQYPHWECLCVCSIVP